ncbi:hypothetical protein Hanom_Chr06g00577911 [Helianthus anomalus]
MIKQEQERESITKIISKLKSCGQNVNQVIDACGLIHQPISVLLTLSTISRLARLLVNGNPRVSSNRNLYTSHSRSDVECLPTSAY